MAYLVARYVGTQRLPKPALFETRDDAMLYLVEYARAAARSGKTVDGDPLDGVFSITGGGEDETFVLVESRDRRVLRHTRSPSLGVRTDRNLP